MQTSGYGTLPRGPPVPVRSGLKRRTKLYVLSAAAFTLAGCVCLLAFQQQDADASLFTELLARGDELDRKYMAAEAQGQSGRSLISRMQEIWFIGSRSKTGNMLDLSKDATSLAVELMTAEVQFVEPSLCRVIHFVPLPELQNACR
jgi:hypothetical protein